MRTTSWSEVITTRVLVLVDWEEESGGRENTEVRLGNSRLTGGVVCKTNCRVATEYVTKCFPMNEKKYIY